MNIKVRRSAVVRFLVSVSALLFVLVAQAYEVETHGEITRYGMLNAYVSVDQELLWRIGVGIDANSPLSEQYVLFDKGVFSSEHLTSISEVVDAGVTFEDDSTRPVNHFFDPVSGTTIEVPGGVYTSPGWSLEEVPIASQDWSYRDFIEYLHSAMVASREKDALQLYGKAFRALGQIVHHVQDMAQPQHSRIDPHCSSWAFCWGDDYEPSFYEWLSLQMSNGGFRNSHGELVIGGSVPGSYPNVNLPHLRDYWTHSTGMGMADYSNSNFVTADTNYALDDQGNVATTEFTLPGLNDWQEITLEVSQVQPYDSTSLLGELTLIRTPMTDHYLGTGPEWTHNTSTRTMLSSDIRAAIDDGVPPERFEGHDNAYYLNRFNYESANNLLFQRAIGYTAGFIDHVFRGRLEIKAPEGGLYAVVDHAVTNDASGPVPQGFESISLRLRNATAPQTSPDATLAGDGHLIKSGTLVAVAMFRPNPCYSPDLSGEPTWDDYIPEGCSRDQWLQTEQQRVISTEISISDGMIDSANFAEYEFDFSANPIPINARDLSIQLVFRGAIGGDADAIAVGRKDISEPTWIGGMASRDITSVDGVYRDTVEFLSSPEAADVWGIDKQWELDFYGAKGIENLAYFNATNGERLTEWGALPIGSYHRLAVLGDPDSVVSVYLTIYYEDTVTTQSFWTSTVRTELFEDMVLREIPGFGYRYVLLRHWMYTPIQSFRGARGTLIAPFALRFGTSATMETILALPDISPGDPLPLMIAP